MNIEAILNRLATENNSLISNIMLFNSYEFILLFLPMVLVTYWFAVRTVGIQFAQIFLVFASVFFYGWWKADNVVLILASIIVNFFIGLALQTSNSYRRTWLVIGVTGNLSLLAYFKYANFFVDNLNAFFDIGYNLNTIVLPLAISFFTFQQIAYLVDSYRGETEDIKLHHYALFVSFFPQLIAGPIVHHKEMMPQFAKPTGDFWKHFSLGITLFAIGLAKKVLIADPLGAFSSPMFDRALAGGSLATVDAWFGSLGYTLQLYFDFSGYSDMALGLGHMFGIRLPINFDSPYRALSISDFWRRWHITLSNFLRDYLYFPLGGNKRGQIITLRNLMITMLLGGLWHGAGWTFVLWGGLHGVYLVVNHVWRKLHVNLPVAVAWGLTFLAVVFGWVMFRAESFDAAIIIYRSLLSPESLATPTRFASTEGWLRIAIGLFISIALPNGVRFVRGESRYLIWRPRIIYAGATTVLILVSLINMSKISEFLYFNF